MAATESLEALVRRTPLVAAHPLLSEDGAEVLLKLECLQRTGSFKLRGAVRAVASLSPGERAAGVVVASAGNHGAGMALACQRAGVPLTVYVPTHTPANKRERIAGLGAEVIVTEVGYDDTEAIAVARATDTGAPFISAFDDERVIAGNGDWLAKEMFEQAPELRAVVVPVGGGGMIAGLARSLAPVGVRVIGAQPRQNCAMHDSLANGTALTDYRGQPTIAEGCEGAVGALAFSIAQPHIDSVVLVSEDEIKAATAYAFTVLGVVIECSAAVALAAVLFEHVQLPTDGPTAIVLSGGNIDEDQLDQLVADAPEV